MCRSYNLCGKKNPAAVFVCTGVISHYGGYTGEPHSRFYFSLSNFLITWINIFHIDLYVITTYVFLIHLKGRKQND